MNMTPESLISHNLALTSLPEVVMQLNDMVADPRCTAADIGDMISRDAALSARLLKIVNSPFYGFPSNVDSLPMAITIIGVRQLRDLVLTTSVIAKYNKIPNDILNPENFWCHSICTAIAAKLIATHTGLPNNERLFTCGLLHDMGKLIMVLAAPDETRQVMELARDAQQSSHSFEQTVFGFTQGQVGAALIRKWRLPESFIEPIELQQTPQQPKRYPMETAILNIANVIANHIDNSIMVGDNTDINPTSWSVLAIDNQTFDDLCNQVHAQLHNIVNAIYYNKAA